MFPGLMFALKTPCVKYVSWCCLRFAVFRIHSIHVCSMLRHQPVNYTCHATSTYQCLPLFLMVKCTSSISNDYSVNISLIRHLSPSVDFRFIC